MSWNSSYPGLDNKLHMLATYLTDHPDASVTSDFASGADCLHADWYGVAKEYPDTDDNELSEIQPDNRGDIVPPATRT